MRLGHYVIIQHTQRHIPGRNEWRPVYKSALDRKVHALLKKKKSNGVLREFFTAGGTTYYVTDDLYRKIYDSVQLPF